MDHSLVYIVYNSIFDINGVSRVMLNFIDIAINLTYCVTSRSNPLIGPA